MFQPRTRPCSALVKRGTFEQEQVSTTPLDFGHPTCTMMMNDERRRLAMINDTHTLATLTSVPVHRQHAPTGEQAIDKNGAS